MIDYHCEIKVETFFIYFIHTDYFELYLLCIILHIFQIMGGWSILLGGRISFMGGTEY